MASRAEVYAAIDSERNYQDMRIRRDEGATSHSVTEYATFMRDYAEQATHAASHTWGPLCDAAILEEMRKVVALGVACMEEHGAPHREGF